MNPLFSLNQVDDTHFIPFPAIQTEHFGPAHDKYLEEARANLKKLETAPATFSGIIEGIEGFRENLDRVSLVFYNLNSANTNEAMQALMKEYSPKMAELANDLLLNAKIFALVKSVYEQKDSLSLSTEQKQLLDKTYKAFRRNGALLNETQKEKLREIDRVLSRRGAEFSEHVLKATNEYVLYVKDFEAIKDLPSATLEDAKATAKAKGKESAWAFTLHFPSYIPFLQYCSREDLRKELWTAYMSKGMKAPLDNKPVLKEIAKLRHERAKLLGYESHAHFVLEERMADNPKRVFSFLEELLQHAKPAAEKDLAEARAAKKKHVGKEDFHPWDMAFYSERVKKEKFNLSEEELRPYFRLENVIEGVFEHAKRLYGLQFKERSDIPVYHQDVKAYEVKDASGAFMGLFYADFFPRESKRGGAWMTNYLEQGTWSGKKLRPHVSIVCNFTKPTPTQPSLLTLMEVKTLFHEFGHALHSLLTDCHYASLSGTNVYWDFVELPSQVMENWSTEEEGLALFARHYQTNAPIPKELVKKIKDSAKFQAGWQAVRQVSLGLLDMGWHSQDPGESDVAQFEKEKMGRALFFPMEPGTSVSASFSHIFAGGYSAGYYSYKWAEVLDADAFEFFKERGLFNQEVAKKFRENVLARGGTEHPMELYKRFRGREPDPKALLRRDGLVNA
jgi:peptidyl-dipeptidase Dcp